VWSKIHSGSTFESRAFVIPGLGENNWGTSRLSPGSVPGFCPRVLGDVTQLDPEYLFDTPNREFAAANQGRWLSPDPAGSGWNQYAYSTNPNSMLDPMGLSAEIYLMNGSGGWDWSGGEITANSMVPQRLRGRWTRTMESLAPIQMPISIHLMEIKAT
jgi:hypothetical protein